jgi:hypothetical protein
MTGSSIATAIASGVAAAVWHANTAALAADIRNTMYTSGIELEGGADFPDAAAVHRISLCRALGGDAAACAEGQLPPISPVSSMTTLSAPSCSSSSAACPVFDPLANSIDMPWTYPQPGGSQCGACFLGMRSGTLVFSASLASPITQTAVVKTTGSDGGQTLYAINPDDSGVQNFSVVLADAAMPASATLSVPLPGDGGTLDPIFILPQ